MTLQSAIDSELPFLRAEAEARMLDTCRITKAGVGAPVFNNTTGQYDVPAAVTVYQGPCRIPRRGAAPASGARSQAGEAAWAVGTYPLAIPVTGAGYNAAPDDSEVKVGMTVTYLTAVDDPPLAGHIFGITEVPRQSQAIERRFVMKEAVG